MSDLPFPIPPAGILIRKAREQAIPRRSRPEVAHCVGIDPGTLGNIERGYRHLGDGQRRRVEADAATLAKLARELGISPDLLETEGERPDAAEILRQPAASPPRLRPVPPPPPDDDDADTDPAESLLYALVAQYGSGDDLDSDVVRKIAAQYPVTGKPAEVVVREIREWLRVTGATGRNGAAGALGTRISP